MLRRLETESGYATSQDPQDFYVHLAHRLQVTVWPFDPEPFFVKKKQEGLDLIYLACHQLFWIPYCAALLQPNGVLVVENARLLMELTQEQLSMFTAKVNALAETEFISIKTENPLLQQHFLIFKVRDV